MDNNNYNYSSGNEGQNPYSNPYSQPGQMPQMQPSQPAPGSGFAIAALIVGILSMTLCCVGGALIGLLGLIFGIVSINKKESGRGMAIAGIITSVLGMLIGIFLIVEVVAVFAGLGNMSQDQLNDLRDEIYKELEKEGYDMDDIYKELEKEGVIVPDEYKVNDSQDPFSGEAYRCGDDSVIYFSTDGTFCWYQDDSDHDRNYYTGIYKVRMGDAAETYITEDLSDLGVAESELDSLLEAYEGMGFDDDQFCCLSLDNEALIGENGETSTDFDAGDSNYMGIYDDNVYGGVRMETGTEVSFTLVE